MSSPIKDRTYRANYLVFPVSCLSSMPDDWQEQFAKMMDEFTEAFPDAGYCEYQVQRVEDGVKVNDKFGYRHDRFQPTIAL